MGKTGLTPQEIIDSQLIQLELNKDSLILIDHVPVKHALVVQDGKLVKTKINPETEKYDLGVLLSFKERGGNVVATLRDPHTFTTNNYMNGRSVAEVVLPPTALIRSKEVNIRKLINPTNLGYNHDFNFDDLINTIYLSSLVNEDSITYIGSEKFSLSKERFYEKQNTKKIL